MNLEHFEKHGSMLIKQGRVNELAAFLSSTRQICQSPSWLSMQATLFGMQGKLEQAFFLFEQVLSNASGYLAARTLLRSVIVLRIWGRYQRALELVLKANRIASNFDLPLCSAEALRLRGQLLFCLGDMQGGIRYQMISLTQYEILGQHENVAMLCNGLGMVYSRQDFFQAKKYYLRCQKYWESVDCSHRLVAVYNNLAVLYTNSGDYELAASYFERALSIGRGHYLEAFLWCGLGELFLELQIYEGAQILFERAKRSGSSDYYLLFCLSLLKARLFAALGLFEESLNLLAAARPASKTDEAALHLAWGEVELRRGGEPQVYFEQASQTSDKLISSQALFFLSLLRGESPSHSLVFEHRYVLIAKLFDNHRLSKYWAREVERFDARLGALRREIRAYNFVRFEPGFYISMLGGFSIKCQGKQIYFPLRDAQNLLCLLLFYRKPKRKRVICEMLWPVMSKGGQDSRFKKAIKVLREGLGSEVVRYENGFYSFNSHCDYEFDVERWEGLVVAGDYAKASSLYQGDFLPDLDLEWVKYERQRLYLQWVEVGIALAEQLLGQGEYNEAWEVIERLLTREEYSERVYCLAMRYWGERGDAARVVRCFSELSRVLADLGLKPSAKAMRARRLYSGE